MDVEERKKNYKQKLDAAASYVCDHICTKLQGVPEEEAAEICTACGTGKHIENLLNAYDEMAAAYKDAEEKQNKSVVNRIQYIGEMLCDDMCKHGPECAELMGKGEIVECPLGKLVLV